MSGLLERESELDAIRGGLADLRNGDGRCIVVEGPAGIGKSALVAEARALARNAGCRAISAVGGELEADFPYGVVRQLFVPTMAAQPDEDTLLAGAAALARPVLSPQTPLDVSAGADSSHALEALHGLYWLTVNLAGPNPLMVAVDDVQWCDAASLRFLIYVRRRLEGLPVLLLVAGRPREPGGTDHLLAQLGADGSDVVRPRVLSRHAVAVLLRAALSEEPDPSFAAAVHSASGGNPFLLRELVNALLDERVRPTADAAGRVAAIGSHGVTLALLRRLAVVGDGATALAQAVAVLGGGTELHHAAELADLDDAAAAELAEALIRVQIIRDERKLTFVHPLVRSAIYADIPALARARVHARAARILKESGAREDAVAAHILESDPGGDATVVAYLSSAAQRAAGQGATDVAARYLRRALAEPPGSDQRGAVLRELGAAELAAGQPDAAAECLAMAAIEAGDLAARVSIVLKRRHALVLADRIGDAVKVVDDVRQRSDAPNLTDLLEAAAVGAGHLDAAVVRTIEDRVARLRDRASDPEISEPLTLAVAAVATVFANRPVEETISLTDRAIAALGNAHPDSDYSVEGQLAVALYNSEQFERLFAVAGAWIDDARRRGSVPRFISMATLRSIGAYRAGSLADAEADARDAVEAARLYGHHFWLPGAVAALINPLVEHGRLSDAEDLLVETGVEQRHSHSHSLWWAAMFLPARGRLRVAQGRLREGLADLLACGERYETTANRSPALWAWRSEAALALAALDDRARAIELAEEELRLARQLGAPRALGVALRAAGIVAEEGDALRLLQEAVSALNRSGAVLEHARVLIDYGSALRRNRRPTEARAPLREGLELAARCGADVLVERARDELAATGAHPRRDRLSGPEALTPSERRVARIASAGRSNPEIAQELFLTRRTVEAHLTSAYQKLGISSRDELAAALG